MTYMNWDMKIGVYCKLLAALCVSARDGSDIPHDKGFRMLNDMLEAVRKSRRTVYAVGNGASAAMASHFAADLAKNGKLHTQVFSDLSLITAISNDMGYSEVFAEPLRRRGARGDLLVAISSSGNSGNIINAVETAAAIGMDAITFSAMDKNNRLRRMGQVNLYVPATTYGDAESCHSIMLHYIIDILICGKGPCDTAGRCMTTGLKRA